MQYLTVAVLPVSAVHPSLLALAVVAGAVGALDDAGGAVGAVLVPGLGAGGAVHHHQQHEEEGGGRGGKDQAGGGGGHLFFGERECAAKNSRNFFITLKAFFTSSFPLIKKSTL